MGSLLLGRFPCDAGTTFFDKVPLHRGRPAMAGG